MSTNRRKDLPKEPSIFDPITSDLLYKRSRGLIRFALTFSALDPPAAKRLDGHSGFSWKRWMSERWPKISFLATIYLSIRPLTTMLLRSTLARLREEHNTYLVDKFNWLLELIGDPYSSPPFANLLLYLFFPSLALWLRCYIPICANYIHPFDCAITKFILEPHKEIHHFDLQASQTLSSAIEAIERHRSNLFHRLRFKQNYSEDYNVSQGLMNRIQRQLDQMRKVREQIQTIRPKALQADWLKRVYPIAFIMLILMTVANSSVVVVGVVRFSLAAWTARCIQLRLPMSDEYVGGESDCGLIEAFNLIELSMIVEIFLLGFVFIAIPSAIFTVFQLAQFAHQLSHTSDISQRLSDLVHELSLTECDCERGLSDALIQSLFANLIGLRMFERESRRCVKMLAHATKFAIFCNIIFTSVAFASIRLQLTLERQISLGQVDAITAASASVDIRAQTLIVYGAWMFAMVQQTSSVFSCAIVPARISHIERTVYSLMAQLVRIQHSYKALGDLGEENCLQPGQSTDDPITSLWRRLTLSRTVDGHLPAVRVLTKSLTYDRVLALQFYIATIIRMLHSYL